MAAPRVLVYSHADVPLFELDPEQLVSLSQIEEINGEHSLTITSFQVLEKEQRILVQDGTLRWHEYVVTGADTEHGTSTPLNTYYCVWSLQHDLEETKVSSMPGVQNPVSAAIALEHALAGTSRWSNGMVTRNVLGGVSMYFMSGWEALGKLVETWGGEIDPEIDVDDKGVVSRLVNLWDKQGDQVATRRFDYGQDLITIKRTVSDDPFVCRIIPRGKGEETENGGYGRRITIEDVNDGIDYLEDADAVPLVRLPDGNGGWEYPTLIVINDQIEQPQELKDWALSVITEYTRPRVSYEANVIQLAQAGMDIKGVGLGDAVQCVDKGFSEEGLRIDGRIVRIEANLLDTADTQLTIGYLGNSLAEQFSLIQSSVETVQAYVEQLTSSMSTPEWIDGLIDRLNREINATGGYVYIVQGVGILTYDKAVSDPLVGAEADAAVEIRGGTIRIADTKDEQGGWEWRTVFTSGHIAAELITAANITAGYIGSADSGTYINLDTGEVVLDAVTAQIQQTQEAVTLTFTEKLEQTTTEIFETADGAYAGKEETEQALDELEAKTEETANALEEEIEQRATYYRFDETGMTIGKTDSELNLVLQNDRISFMDEGAEVAYASGGEFYAPNMSVDSQLRMARWAWIPRANGNLALKWLG